MESGAVTLASLESGGREMAVKLHRQFGHPSPVKLLKLLRDAGVNNSVLEKAVSEVSEKCEICFKFKRARPKPIVSLPMASRFNEVIAMDLKCWGRQYFLVMVDLATRFCTAIVIDDKRASTILNGVFRGWIAVFGPPGKILSDNGCEFNNSEMRALGEAFNVKIMATAAESPWSNGVCERQNAVIGDIVRKIVADTHCDLEVALAWAVSARNALANYSGFSPNQLVFGYNPALPCNFVNDPPALKTAPSDIVRSNLNALHLARQEFVRAESSERLARALRHNVRPSDKNIVQNGDEVFYKRNDSHEWYGPGTVIGRDGKQILVRHGGIYVRAHECRVTKTPVEKCGEGNVELAQANQGGETLPVAQDYPPDEESSDECDDNAASQDESTGGAAYRAPKVKAGQRIQGILAESGELVSGKLLSRAGKATGNYKHCYNWQRDSDGGVGWVDLQKDFSSCEVVSDSTELLVFFNSEDIIRAKESEIDNWRSNDVYEETDNVGQDAISVRWVVTEKLKDGKSIIKARLVARGFEEDTVDLRTDSPTCSKEAVRLTLAFASANQWICHSIDVKAAYLQGDVIERDICLRPPPEYDNGRLWKLKKAVYGLCDAARHWYLRVKDQLLKLGAKISSLDPALFYWRNGDIVDGIICIYVDDFLWAGTANFEREVINVISQTFLVGTSESGVFKYVGLNIVSHDDGSMTLDQFQYALSLKPIVVSRQRAMVKSGELSDSEKTEYRAVIGQLNWIATHTRPDVAFDVCELSVARKGATVADVLRLNKVIDRVKTDNMKLYIPRLGAISSCHLECFSDASFANLAGNGSQGGFVIFLRDADGGRCPILWQTRKIRRVVKSTLSAEAMALLECAEAAVYVASVLHEISGGDRCKIRCFVDNKSLVDALQSCKHVEDRRLRIDVAVLRDMLERGEIEEVSWVDTSLQLADCLTKRGASSRQLRAAVSRN